MTASGTIATRAPGDPLTPVMTRVVSCHQERADTVTIGLRPVDEQMATMRPGQFNMLWAPGVGEVAISVSRITADRGATPHGEPPAALLHTVRSVGAATRALVTLRVGDVVGIRGPYGTSWDIEDRRFDGADLVVIAGGLGMAPLRPVVDESIRQRHRFSACRLLVGARAPDEVLFSDDHPAWRSAFEIDVIVDRPDPGWHGPVGLVTDLLGPATPRPDRTVAMVCGPELMMVRTADALVALGVPPQNIRVSLERNMKCAIAMCGHCQLGGSFVCHDGPVYGYDGIGPALRVAEL